MSFIKKGHANTSEKTLKPGYKKNLKEIRQVVVIGDSVGKAEELVGDGTSTVLDLMQASDFITDLTALTAIPTEPTVDTPEHTEWEIEYDAFKTIPAEGTVVLLSGNIILEAYEEV